MERHSLAEPTLNILRTLTLAYGWAKSSNTSLFHNKVWNISCNLLNSVKVKNRITVWGQNGSKCIGCSPLWQSG